MRRCYRRCLLLNRFPVPDKWVWEDIGSNYGAGAYGINIFDNTAVYFFSAGVNGTTSISRVEKDLPDMINNNDISVSRLSKESLLAYCAPYSNKRFFHGSLMPGRKNVPLKVSTSNPPLVAAYYLYKNLIAGGVGITGAPCEVILGSSLNCTLSDPIIPAKKGSSPCSGKTPSNEFSFENHTVLDTFYSAPIADIIKVTNFKSNNLYAESIFRHIGLLVANSSASSSNSIDTIRSFWSQKGVNLDFMRIYDGCGLSPQGAIPAASVVDILLYMYNSKNYSYFLSSLPLAKQSFYTMLNLNYYKGAGRRIAKSDRKALCSPPQRRNPLAAKKNMFWKQRCISPCSRPSWGTVHAH